MNATTDRILRALVAGTSETDEELASRLNLPVESLRDRIGALERRRTILGYEVLPQTDVKVVEAWVFMEFRSEFDKVSKTLLQHPFLRAAYAGPGRYSLMLRLAGPSLEELADFAQEHLSNSSYGDVKIRPVRTIEGQAGALA